MNQEMEHSLWFGIGVLGNATSLLLYAAPVLTFSRVIRKRSTEEFSCVPYIIALLNCLIYTWYGLPIVSKEWENFPVVTINGLGVVLEFTFILIYILFTSNKNKAESSIHLNHSCLQMKLVATLVAVVLAFNAIAVVSTFMLHDHHHRKMFVGSIGLVASVAMYGSPLVAMRRVIMTKSVEFMPFYLSLFSFLASSLWMAYGLLGHDLILASPNLAGSPLGLLQLLLYCKYRKRGVMGGGGEQVVSNWEDLESNRDDNSNQSKLIFKAPV
ncbi:hypothetical protein MLD38_030424 [Melastoma candidum]|uniref:Uncharacterized protein n=1 Tax=Melastoma candidum TaxID=119954 RepID=A0ACB9ML58_9MYRT|nr:hypothetical protein MLD38_030424 [Melastoma candidum]